MNMTPPICAVCNRQVDRFERQFNVETNTYVFVAKCHGQRQVVQLTDYDIHNTNLGGISVVRAFEDLSIGVVHNN